MKKTFWSTLLLLLMCTVAQAQSLTIKGNVVSKTDGEPIIGVTVVETANSTNGTITDFDGNFTLTVSKGAELTFSYVGFKTQQLKAEATMKVVMAEDSEMLNEVVVVGYSTQKKADLTGAVAVVSTSICLTVNLAKIFATSARVI